MNAPSLFLHVGIHKTASTYIQHRLKRNESFLLRHQLLYPKTRRDHLQLVNALRQGNMQPWQKLLDRAERKKLRPLISEEVLSLLLGQPSRSNNSSILSCFLDFLDQRGFQLKLVGFLRDQPDYLNSRYTQLIKRLYFTRSFESYVAQVMRSSGESACDFEELFGEALDCDRVHCTFIPFLSAEGDPCERLLSALGLVDCAGLMPLTQRINPQPGWKGVWIALRIARKLRQNHPQAWRNAACKARIRQSLEAIALKEGWQNEPFQGLDEQVLCSLENRYGASNDRFAQRVWGCSWRDVFHRPMPQLSPIRPRSQGERHQLVALSERLLAEGLRVQRR
ncbi:hypothetical protein [Cyanobium sp. CH-040]|uniref:hypothetical protein n=1 Tax=Cyanobium sp. CH-040 TaxID=2823708 RepID=UPI0020CC7050|nr:hypothetical protein [Cyanobium sp. CH-040]MCP9927995.1 hypothetical protein [Cyanobium sp. CH-040]